MYIDSKVMKVIKSCTTKDHFNVAEKYIELACNAYSGDKADRYLMEAHYYKELRQQVIIWRNYNGV